MGSEDERVAWLRAQAEGDKAAALACTPGPWEFEGDDPTDDEVYSVHDGEHGDLIGDTVAYSRGYSQQVPNGQHIAIHDPRDVIADCAAKLAILDEHLPQDDGMYCRTCVTERHGYPEEWPDDPFPCRTVVSLSRAYRHREGWRQHWGVEAKAAQ